MNRATLEVKVWMANVLNGNHELAADRLRAFTSIASAQFHLGIRLKMLPEKSEQGIVVGLGSGRIIA